MAQEKLKLPSKFKQKICLDCTLIPRHWDRTGYNNTAKKSIGLVYQGVILYESVQHIQRYSLMLGALFCFRYNFLTNGQHKAKTCSCLSLDNNTAYFSSGEISKQPDTKIMLLTNNHSLHNACLKCVNYK